jgi:hypothetical protein
MKSKFSSKRKRRNVKKTAKKTGTLRRKKRGSNHKTRKMYGGDPTGLIVLFMIITTGAMFSGILTPVEPRLHMTTELLLNVFKNVTQYSPNVTQVPYYAVQGIEPLSKRTIIVIPDTHGVGLPTFLYEQNITRSLGQCEWAIEDPNTIVVQLGDVVDRGQYALEDWKCMRELQSTAPKDNVFRLIGNHEELVANRRYYYGHKVDRMNDDERIRKLSNMITADVLIGDVKASVSIDGLLFSHAGFNPRLVHEIMAKRKFKFEEYIESYKKTKDIDTISTSDFPDILSNYANSAMLEYFKLIDLKYSELLQRIKSPPQTLMLLSTGEARGGPDGTIGGVFWWDPAEGLEDQGAEIPGVVAQIVGHTPQVEGVPRFSESATRLLLADTGLQKEYGDQGLTVIRQNNGLPPSFTFRLNNGTEIEIKIPKITPSVLQPLEGGTRSEDIQSVFVPLK